MALRSDGQIYWSSIPPSSAPRASFKEPWSGQAVLDDFQQTARFYESLLNRKVLSQAERDQLEAQKDVFESLTQLGPEVRKTDILDFLSDALAEHLTRAFHDRSSYAMARLQVVTELTEAISA